MAIDYVSGLAPQTPPASPVPPKVPPEGYVIAVYGSRDGRRVVEAWRVPPAGVRGLPPDRWLGPRYRIGPWYADVGGVIAIDTTNDSGTWLRPGTVVVKFGDGDVSIMDREQFDAAYVAAPEGARPREAPIPVPEAPQAPETPPAPLEQRSNEVPVESLVVSPHPHALAGNSPSAQIEINAAAVLRETSKMVKYLGEENIRLRSELGMAMTDYRTAAKRTAEAQDRCRELEGQLDEALKLAEAAPKAADIADVKEVENVDEEPKV